MSHRSRPGSRDGVAPAGAGSADVLAGLRAVTAGAHARVEAALDLTAADLSIERLGDVVARLGAFWAAAEAGLDVWASSCADDATRIGWTRRRRAVTFAADAAALGAAPAPSVSLPAVATTAAALGRLYVLEGSTLGGQVLTRAFASRPASDPVSAVRLSCFTPYGDDTGRMWQSYRREVRAWVEAGGDAQQVREAAAQTFGALEAWCAPLGRHLRVAAL